MLQRYRENADEFVYPHIYIYIYICVCMLYWYKTYNILYHIVLTTVE